MTNSLQFSEKETKILLFLINFFDGIWLAFNYPWQIFCSQEYSQEEIKSFWLRHNKSSNYTQLYLHTLFCETKCHYCNCISYVDNDKSNHEKYLDYIVWEIQKYWKVLEKPLDTLYFWGGTFSLWEYDDMETILREVTENFNFSSWFTWMVELHPESTTKEKLILLKKYWITNVMVWLQSLNKQVSEKNNRPYDENKIHEVINDIVDIWFKKICFDIMYNLPYETYDDVVENFKKLKDIGEDLSWKIEINLEINKWNLSYNVPYYKIWVRDNYERFVDFLEEFYSLLDRKTTFVNDYWNNHLSDIYSKVREEIDSRTKNNTAIMWLWYGAISYVPWIATYGHNFSYKKIKTFYSDTSYVWHNLSKEDNDKFYFLNNLRSGIEKWFFIKSLEEIVENRDKRFYFKKIKSLISQNNKWEVYFNLDNDLQIHELALCYYSYDRRKEILKDLLKRWKTLWYSGKDLENNIETYLWLYYKRNATK